MKLYKNLLISFVTAIVTISVTYSGYTIYAQDSNVQDMDFRNPSGSFVEVQAAYHVTMNQYFNDKIAMLVELLEDENFDKKPDFNPPVGDACPETNVSSYCVSMGALDLYIDYVETLNQMKGYLPTGELPPGGTAEDLLKLNISRDDEIDIEVEEAKVAMQGAVGVYDEFRLAYPMHQRYEVIINNLIKYKISLAKIGVEVKKFPLKFIDATSVQCR